VVCRHPAAKISDPMSKNPIKAAIAYDFDGTLAPGNMQEHSFLPKLGIPKEEFWKEANRIARENDMDGILAYMNLMLQKSIEKEIPIRRADFNNYGSGISFFPGVESYFDLINTYARDRGIELEHHIISSGLREFIEGTAIARYFKNIFASGFKYDNNGIAEWAALAINYTNKTQYLFRINKGIDNSWDNEKINRFLPEEDETGPLSKMIYIGDGETDVPAMKMLKYQGGATIAVYNPDSKTKPGEKSQEEKCRDMISQNRTDYVAPADYSENGELVRTVKLLIERIRVVSL
jgi:2-hydroxy-3-keto-5-methylthiopentenyl-1-phosphate phosphatase